MKNICLLYDQFKLEIAFPCPRQAFGLREIRSDIYTYQLQIVENMLHKVTEEFEHRIVNQTEQVKRTKYKNLNLLVYCGKEI